jgi:hypothetical protein
MSGTEVELGSQDIEQTEALANEQLSALGNDEAEGSTQESAEEAIEQVSINDLAGETKALDSEKKTNNLYAQNRVMSRKLKELESQIEAGNLPPEHAFKPVEKGDRPKLTDFVNDTRLYDEFNGSEALALASFNEAKEEWAESRSSLATQEQSHNEQLLKQVQADKVADEQFIASIDGLRGRIPDIDQSLEKAETVLGVNDFEAIRGAVGGNAALVLGVIGANAEVQAELSEAAATGHTPTLIKYLTRLEDRIVSNLPSKTVSKAGGETPLGGGSGSMIDYDAEIVKVYNDPAMRGMKGVNRIKELRAARDSLAVK